MTDIRKINTDVDEWVYQCLDCGAYAFKGKAEDVKCHDGCTAPDPAWFEDEEGEE